MKRKLTKMLTIVLMICAVLCIAAACSKNQDSVLQPKQYSFSIEDGYITGIVEYGSEPIMIIPNEIDGQKVVGIESILVYASRVEEIVIPATVVEIKDYAIYTADYERDINIVFEDNSKLERIGVCAIRHLQISSIILPDGIKEIGENAFTFDTSFEYNVENNIKYVGSKSNPYMYLVSAESIALSEAEININCKFIKEGAFKNCVLLTEVEIPNGVVSIGSRVFWGCSDLSKVVIPDSVSYIGTNIFYNCNKLKFNVDKNLKYLGNNENPYIYLAGMVESDVDNLTINSNCKFIGDSAFENCCSKSITIPEGVLGLGYSCLMNSETETIILPKTLKFISDFTSSSNGDGLKLKEVAYNGTIEEWVKIEKSNFDFYDASFYTNGNLVDKVKISNVDSLSSSFSGCGSIISVEISDVKYIPGSIFRDCRNLTSVKIGKGVKKLTAGAFYRCFNLTDVEIGEDVKIVDTSAFYNCNNLSNVIFKNPNGWSYGNENISSSDLSNAKTAAVLLKNKVSDYGGDYWIRQEGSENVG